jgi:hypothetical protein
MSSISLCWSWGFICQTTHQLQCYLTNHSACCSTTQNTIIWKHLPVNKSESGSCFAGYLLATAPQMVCQQSKRHLNLNLHNASKNLT